jgi:hypothetical protein
MIFSSFRGELLDLRSGRGLRAAGTASHRQAPHRDSHFQRTTA